MKSVYPPGLVDAVAMAEKHPDTFDGPTRAETNRLRLGDYAKICVEPDDCPAERFWVQIVGIQDGGAVTRPGRAFVGTVSNSLVFTEHHGLAEGVPVSFDWCHIYDTETS